MNQTSQNSEIQIWLPGSGGLCTFPLDSSTRFSDVFRALIGKGCFACPQGKRPVWVLLCGDQDLVTWVSDENTFYDRFPFGEPPHRQRSRLGHQRGPFHFLPPRPVGTGPRQFICTLKVPSPLWGMRDFCGSTRAIRSRRSRKRSGRPSAAIGKIKAAVDFPDGKLAAIFYT